MYAHPCCVLFIFDLGKGVVVGGGGGGGAGAAFVCNALVHVIHARAMMCALCMHIESALNCIHACIRARFHTSCAYGSCTSCANFNQHSYVKESIYLHVRAFLFVLYVPDPVPGHVSFLAN